MQLERMKKTVMFEREQRRALILEFETYAKNMQDVFEQMETSKQVCVTCVFVAETETETGTKRERERRERERERKRRGEREREREGFV